MFNWLSTLFMPRRSRSVLHLLTCSMHGSRYYDCLDLIAAGKVQKNQRLVLRREPDNEYDECAIEVYTLTGDKLGYVPKNHNRVIAALMDQHCKIDAVIVRLDRQAWEPVTLRIEFQQFS